MRKILGILIVLSFIAGPALAQWEPFEGPPCKMKKLAEHLGLSEEQLTQIKQLRMESTKQSIQLKAKLDVAELELRAMMEEPKPNRGKIENKVKEIGALRTQLHLLQIDRNLKMREILTPEQLDKLEELKEKIKHRKKEEKPFHPFEEERSLEP